MMQPDLSRVNVYLRPGNTDMRKRINGLSILATEEMELDPLSGAVFLFCNRERRILKALYWDANGFCEWQKKVERDRFPWPDSEEAAREITTEELSLLLRGIDFFHAHKRRRWQSVS